MSLHHTYSFNKESEVEVYYHANCHDGHVAAFTLWLDLHDKVRAKFYPIQQGSKPPDVRGKIVYILDFAYSEEQIRKMIDQAEALLIIDHHLTSRNDLEKIPEKYKIFDMNESAATLTWQYLYPEKPLPSLHQYIRSRDIWSNDMPNTLAFTLAFDLAIRDKDGRYSFELTEKYLAQNEIVGLIGIGKVLQTYHDAMVEKTIARIFFCPIRRDNKILIVAYVNCPPELTNDTSAKCMNDYPFVDFCAFYHLISSSEEAQFQLRSREDREDVSVIASEHGGGGHRNASSFRLKEPKCRLNYEHLDPWPLWCIFRQTQLKISQSNMDEVFSSDYFLLLRRKFPGRSLKIDLDLST